MFLLLLHRIYKSSGTWNFYNGLLKGTTAGYSGAYGSLRSSHGITTGTSGNYKTAYLIKNYRCLKVGNCNVSVLKGVSIFSFLDEWPVSCKVYVNKEKGAFPITLSCPIGVSFIGRTCDPYFTCNNVAWSNSYVLYVLLDFGKQYTGIWDIGNCWVKDGNGQDKSIPTEESDLPSDAVLLGTVDDLW